MNSRWVVFTDKFNVVINSSRWISLVPLLTGMFWGGPLIAREVEQGTHRLAWTQSVSRSRWLVTKLGIFALGAAVVAAVLTQVMTWWLAPVEQFLAPVGARGVAGGAGEDPGTDMAGRTGSLCRSGPAGSGSLTFSCPQQPPHTRAGDAITAPPDN